MALVTLLIVAFVAMAALGQWFNNRIPNAPREQAALPDAPVLTVPVSAASPTALFGPTSIASPTLDTLPPAVSTTQPQAVSPAPPPERAPASV